MLFSKLKRAVFEAGFDVETVIDKRIWTWYNSIRWFVSNEKQAAVAQSVERRIGSAEVTGSIPVSSFIAWSEAGDIAQLGEHLLDV